MNYDALGGIGTALDKFWTAYQGAKTSAEDRAFRQRQLELQDAARKAELERMAAKEAEAAKRYEKEQAFDREKFEYGKQKDALDRALKKKEVSLGGYADPLKQAQLEKLLQEIKTKKSEREVEGYNTETAKASTNELEAFRKIVAAKNIMENYGNKLADLVDKYGTEAVGPVKAEMDQIYDKMLTTQKEIEKLGQLTGGDVKLATNIVGESPTTPGANIASSIPFGSRMGLKQPEDYAKNFRSMGTRTQEVITDSARALGISPNMQIHQAAPKVPGTREQKIERYKELIKKSAVTP
jgi:hypothetical protein